MATDVINTDTLAHIVDAISTNLGIAAKQIFDVFVGAQPIIGILDITFFVLAILVAYCAWKVSRKTIIEWSTDDDGNWEDVDSRSIAALIPIVISTVVFLLLWVILSLAIEPSVLKIICPEYTAMKEIIGVVHP